MAEEFYQIYNPTVTEGWTPYIIGALGGTIRMDSYTPVSYARYTTDRYNQYLRQTKDHDWTMPELVRELEKAADKYGIYRKIAYDQINAESSFNVNANSGKAYGIAQFTPGTAARYGLTDRSDPIASFDAWGRYMRDLLRQFNGDYSKALAGYNWGEGRVITAIAKYGEGWKDHLPKETSGYLAKILQGGGNAPQGQQTNPVSSSCGTFDLACHFNNFLTGDTAKDVAKRVALVALALVLVIVAVVSLR